MPRRTGFARLLQVALLLVPIGAGLALSFAALGRAARRAAPDRAPSAGALALAFAVFVTVHGQRALDGRRRAAARSR